MSEEYEKFLNWCEEKWFHEHKIQKLLSKLSNDDIDFLKNQYEARLKTNMMAMLIDLQLEINKAETHRYDDQIDKAFNQGLHRSSEIIQQKIDKLK